MVVRSIAIKIRKFNKKVDSITEKLCIIRDFLKERLETEITNLKDKLDLIKLNL